MADFGSRTKSSPSSSPSSPSPSPSSPDRFRFCRFLAVLWVQSLLLGVQSEFKPLLNVVIHIKTSENRVLGQRLSRFFGAAPYMRQLKEHRLASSRFIWASMLLLRPLHTIIQWQFSHFSKIQLGFRENDF